MSPTASIDTVAFLATLGCAGIGTPGMSIHVLTLNAFSFGLNLRSMDCVDLPDFLLSNGTAIAVIINAVFLSLIWFHFAMITLDPYMVASLGMRLVLDGRFALVVRQLTNKE